MRFGLMISAQYPPGTRVWQEVPKLVEQVQAARELGFDSIWALQHYLGNLPTLQPVPLLARLAAEAGPMKVGTNILILPLHHPVEVAEAFSTLDHLTGGRVVAGFGLGYRQNEFEAFGLTLKERVGRFREAIEVIRGLWRGEPFTYEGKHFRIHEQTIGLPPVQPGGPPIWLGASGEPGVRRAAALGDAWIILHDAKPKRIAGLLDVYRSELRALGRSLDREYPVFRELCLAEDPAVAWEEGRRYLYPEAEAYAAYGLPWFTEKFDDLCAKAYLFTDPATCVERLRELEALGVTYVIVRAQWSGIPQSSVLRTLRLFGEQVMPHFTGRSGTAARA
ncbi:MAG: LLM class flavin-dependent oxidoreductase [Clostridia bacterium]|nr:LLM class flavin-dependent oxidoreductase [Clostridia bacterium]